MSDAFMQEYLKVKRERNLTTEDVAEIIGINADSVGKYESGASAPSVNFICKVRAKLLTDISMLNDLTNIFVQGCFGDRIPLLTEDDIISDSYMHIAAYYEIPDLNEYEAQQLFAIRYTGNNVPEHGIMHDSVLVFARCKRMSGEGIYAVVKRKALKLEAMKHDGERLRIEKLNGKRNVPRFCKSSAAIGRLVACVNKY